MSRFSRFTRSNNPFMREEKFQAASQAGVMDGSAAGVGEGQMTVNGAINKTLILSGIMLITTLFAYLFYNPIFVMGGAIGGLIVVLIAAFNPQRSAILAPIYAALEGLFIGGISFMYASLFDGIIFQAATLTLSILFMMLFIYRTGLIPVTDKFRTGVFMATGGIALVYLLNFVLSFFGISIPYLHSGGTIGIVISIAIIGIASLNLLLDFDNFEKGEQYGAPKYMEWFSAMGLLITLVWIYVEVLRLLAIFASED